MEPAFSSLLSSLEPFQKQDIFPHNAIHPFATAAPATCALLQDLINTTDQISNSLAVCDSPTTWSNAKLISLLRQHTSIEHTTCSSAKNIQHLVNLLSTRSGVSYGENLPLLSASFPQWCIEQLAAWGTSAGMETFKDDSREDSSTVVLGGKVLVVDVDFVIERSDPLNPILRVSSVKTSNALLPGNTNSPTSTLTDSFLAGSIEEYCVEMQKPEKSRNIERASRLRNNVLDHLHYLVVLDGLANRKEYGGLRWFTDIDEICPTLNDLAKSEAEVITSSLSMSKAPLDIFLLRSHSLPLPYLTMPSISFLVYLSPLVYLSLVRNGTDQSMGDDDGPPLDISISSLRSHLNTTADGVTIAVLYVEKLSEAHLYPASMSMPNLTARPTFPLVSSASDFDHSFPQLDGFGMEVTSQDQTPQSEPHAWVLDFTERGKRSGIVMSQSRMKAIELVVNPLGGDGLSNVSDILSFGTGSWVDLLLNPGNAVSPERYTALYTSPNSLHPPLQLRLTTPDEPGLTLERIPVHSIKEVWGILEVVREQCWLNEILLSCHWVTEGLESAEDIIDDSLVTDDDLQAVLSGTFTPRQIPVNVFLPPGSDNAPSNLFGPPDLNFSLASGPRIIMTSPERAPIPGFVEITVSHDETKPRGVSIDIQGAMGCDLKLADLEEICRRGGTLGLSGRVWVSGHGSAS